MREKFNPNLDEALLANGFKYYDDWEYGPESGYSTGYEHYTIKLMRHDFGYWIILDAHNGGNRTQMNIGSSNCAEEIIAVKNALEKLW